MIGIGRSRCQRDFSSLAAYSVYSCVSMACQGIEHCKVLAVYHWIWQLLFPNEKLRFFIDGGDGTVTQPMLSCEFAGPERILEVSNNLQLVEHEELDTEGGGMAILVSLKDCQNHIFLKPGS